MGRLCWNLSVCEDGKRGEWRSRAVHSHRAADDLSCEAERLDERFVRVMGSHCLSVLVAGAPLGRCGGCEVTAAAGLEILVITSCRCKGRSSTRR